MKAGASGVAAAMFAISIQTSAAGWASVMRRGDYRIEPSSQAPVPAGKPPRSTREGNSRRAELDQHWEWLVDERIALWWISSRLRPRPLAAKGSPSVAADASFPFGNLSYPAVSPYFARLRTARKQASG